MTTTPASTSTATSTVAATATSTASPTVTSVPTATSTASPAPTSTATPTTLAGASASFLAQDAATSGNWKGAYGAQGYWLAADGQSLPSFAPSTLSNAITYTWAGATSDPRALVKAGGSGDRVAATWYSWSSFVVDVGLTDGQAHKVSLYGLDWDQGGRAETIEALDAATGVVLDRRSLSSFVGGRYLSWTVSGHVQFRVTMTGGYNAVLSGLFFD